MEPSSVVDLTRDEDDLEPSQNNEITEINCPERPGTPNTKCSICLEDLNNKCNTDSCSHTFCFECLKRWSDEQPFCPLCKSIFKSIHHSFTSHGLHETYNVPSQEYIHPHMIMNFFTESSRNDGSLVNIFQTQRFNNRTFQMNYFDNPHSHLRGFGLLIRTQVYSDDLWAQPVPDIRGQFRECTPDFFRGNPHQVDRLHSYVLRDVKAIRSIGRSRRFSMSADENTITTMIMQAIPIHEIRDAFMSDLLRPYLWMYTEHFCHELFNYSNSLYDLFDYDNRVTFLRREEHSIRMSTASFNIPVILGETIILDTDDEEVDTVTSQLRPEVIELTSDNSNIEIVNRDQPSTSSGITNSLNQPNNRYNLRRQRLFQSTSNGSSNNPDNFSRTSHLGMRIIMDSSSSDEEFITSAYKRKKRTTKKNKFKKQKTSRSRSYSESSSSSS